MGVTCETMSLQLLTAQTKLVEALAGMYMKSTVFRADEGLGELSLPGAPQVGLVCGGCSVFGAGEPQRFGGGVSSA